jgi:hypothetical protein
MVSIVIIAEKCGTIMIEFQLKIRHKILARVT